MFAFRQSVSRIHLLFRAFSAPVLPMLLSWGVGPGGLVSRFQRACPADALILGRWPRRSCFALSARPERHSACSTLNYQGKFVMFWQIHGGRNSSGASFQFFSDLSDPSDSSDWFDRSVSAGCCQRCGAGATRGCVAPQERCNEGQDTRMPCKKHGKMPGLSRPLSPAPSMRLANAASFAARRQALTVTRVSSQSSPRLLWAGCRRSSLYMTTRSSPL